MMINTLAQWGTAFSYSQIEAWMTCDKTSLVNTTTSYGSAAMWNDWVNTANWFSTQNLSSMWNRLTHPTAGTCANMARVGDFFGGLGAILLAIPGAEEIGGAFAVVGGCNLMMHSMVC